MDLELALNDKQADVIIAALELWARIGCGELTALLGHPEISRRLTTDKGVTTEDVRRLLEHLKIGVFGLPRNAYYGIVSSDITESNRIAFDLMQVIRHRLSWSRAGNPAERTPDMYHIAFEEPQHTSTEPLATMRDVREPL